MPQLDPTSFVSQLFWLAICFSFLYILLSRFALPKVENILKIRQDTISGNLDKAESIRKQAEEIEEQYNLALKQVRLDSAKILAETEAKIKAVTEAKFIELDKTLAAELEKAEIDFNQLKTELNTKLDKTASSIASQVFEKLIGTKIDNKQLEQVFNHIKQV